MSKHDILLPIIDTYKSDVHCSVTNYITKDDLVHTNQQEMTNKLLMRISAQLEVLIKETRK